jgi:hypothetical protein
MKKLLLSAGLCLLFVLPAAITRGDSNFSSWTYRGRYTCELHPLEGNSDKAGAVLLIYPSGQGNFNGGTLVGARQVDQQCPLTLCSGTSCAGFTFSNPSSYSVRSDGRGTSTENYYRVSTGSPFFCTSVSFETGSTFLLSPDGSRTKFVYFDSLEDTNEVWGDKRAIGTCDTW